MDARTHPALHAARRWSVIAAGAALGSLLVLATPSARADGVAPVPNTVIRCVVHGITTYSDQPCPDGIGERQVAVDNAGSPVSIVATDTRPAPHVRQARCEAAEAELNNIDTLTRQGQPRDMQAFLDARRQQRRNEQFRLRC